jgi:hypothetical protein
MDSCFEKGINRKERKVDMLKKYVVSTVASLMCLSGISALADAPATSMDMYTGGGVLGLSTTTLMGDPEALVSFGYYAKCWMVDIGANYENLHRRELNIITTLGHLGLRNCLLDKLFVSYGAMGLCNFVVDHDLNNWSVGAFAGLDYQLSKHFMLTGKVYPYNYEHGYGRERKNNVFANGTVSLFYVF